MGLEKVDRQQQGIILICPDFMKHRFTNVWIYFVVLKKSPLVTADLNLNSDATSETRILFFAFFFFNFIEIFLHIWL